MNDQKNYVAATKTDHFNERREGQTRWSWAFEKTLSQGLFCDCHHQLFTALHGQCGTRTLPSKSKIYQFSTGQVVAVLQPKIKTMWTRRF